MPAFYHGHLPQRRIVPYHAVMRSSPRIVLMGSGGVEGRSATQYLLRRGFTSLVLADPKEHEVPAGCSGSFGEGWLAALADADVIVRNPGNRLDLPELEAARARGAVVTSGTRMLLEGCAALGIPACPARVAAVTGSNGKTTCTSLLHQMVLRRWERTGSPGRVWLGGNIGTAVLDFADDVRAEDLVILELSSFQLEDAEASPWLGLVLNVQPNHLDHHTDAAAYAAAKRRCIDRPGSAWAVLNADDPTTASWAQARGAGTTRTFTGRGDGFTAIDESGQPVRVAVAADALRFKTFPETIAAAVQAAVLLGCSAEDAVAVLTSFTGVEHRLQLVGTLDGVAYYDDSANTTPESTLVALQAFPPERTVLILGGSDKGVSFDALARAIVDARPRVVLMGQMAPRIAAAIRALDPAFPLAPAPEQQQDFRAVMDAARALARPGDSVLLSPACASFGMFRDYKDRAAQFVSVVRSWGRP